MLRPLRHTTLLLGLTTLLSSIPEVSFAQGFDCKTMGDLAQYDPRCFSAPSGSQAAPATPVDRSLPLPEDIGTIMAQGMCQQLLSPDKKIGADYGQRVAATLVSLYGENTTQRVLARFDKFDTLFSPNHKGSYDAYDVAMFRSFLLNIVSDNACFPAFLHFAGAPEIEPQVPSTQRKSSTSN